MSSVVPVKIIQMPRLPTMQPAVQLEARPLGIFLNCGYGIYEGSRRLAKIKFDNGFNSFLASFDVLGISTLWDKGYRGWVVTPAARYRVRQKNKFIKTTIWLEQNKTSVVEARQRLIPPVIFLEHGGQEYRLEVGKSVDYQITVDGKPVGYVKPTKRFFSRKIHFLVPTSLPLTKQLLMIWIHLDNQF
jgi:hypothetical protein